MSWLNFNDSLNNLKGQITNFATNVLADNEEVGNNIHDKDVEELRKICVRQELEITNLKKFNQELTANFQNYKQNVSPGAKHDESWDNWAVQEETASNTQTSLTDQIKQLETEKQELVAQLDQLDADHQQTISGVVSIKARLQNENSDLKRDVEKLKEEIKALKSGQKPDGSQEKYEILLRDFHKVREELEESKKNALVLDSSNKTLQKIVEDTKSLAPSNDEEIETCRKRIERLEKENKLYLVNFQKAKETLTEYEQKTAEDVESYKKLSNILENYQEQVTSLKNDLKRVRTSNEAILRENEAMHKMYVNILTENMKKYVECKSPNDFQPIEQEDASSLKEFSNQVENIVKILIDFKFKSERLERDLCELSEEKSKMLGEKNHEIEKLMHNSEALSHELMSKTGALKQYEKECTELIDNNDMLVTELESMKSNSAGLQTISESNEDNLLLLESQLENANKRIEDLEKIVDELERLKDVGSEMDALKEQLKNKEDDYKILLATYDKLQVEHNVLKNEFKNNSKMLEDIKSDYENTEYKLSEVDVNLDTLREENETFKRKIDGLVEEKDKFQVLFTESDESNGKLREELMESRKKCLEQEELYTKQEHQVEQLIEKLKNCKVSETTIKLQYDTLNKEYASLFDIKSSLENALQETNKNLESFQENFIDLQRQNEKLEKLISEKQLELDELDGKSKTPSENPDSDSFRKLELAQKQLDELNVSRNELIALVNTKHQECITYHNEIQRLSQLLSSEVEKCKQLQLQLDQKTHSKELFVEKDQQIEALSEENSFLKGKCDVLAKNLLEEQAKLPRVIADCSEKEMILTKNLERLQSHLIEVEEHYTQELLQYEQKNTELQAKMGEIEQREKNSSTMYTSVSIRANQQVEVLQNQVQILKNQREEAMKKLSDYEDENNKKAAALSNLQFVLEQFQKDREKDVRSETERIRRQIGTERAVQDELRNEIQSLKIQLEESKQGLKAASRLSDQLEQSKKLVTTLKDEVNQLQEKLTKNESKLKSMSSQTDGKVDKSLVKNLLIGYICSNANSNMNKDQMQVLKIIATVLDFNQQDHDKVNLNKPQGGSNSWWGSFLASQSGQGMSQESLSQAFIKFLENESKPRIVPSLLDTASGGGGGESKQSTPRQSPHTLSEIVLPTFADFAQSRNSSSILKDVLKDNSV